MTSNIVTYNRTYEFPDKDGIVALLDDISDPHLVSIEDYGGVADNGTTDSSQAFLDAVDELIALGGGTLLIPNRGTNRFYITNNQTFLIKNMSNITITGGGKIYIDGSNNGSGAQSVTQGRGAIIKIADGTDKFTVREIDILVAESCLANNFINAVFCQEELGGWSNVIFERVKIHSEARPDTQIGNHGISFYRDTTNVVDTKKCFNLTIRDCDIYLTGQSVYGIRTLRDIENIIIDNNTLELTAWQTDSSDAYNAIAMYGDSRNFNISNNKIKSSGHSAIAASMAENGSITGNFVYNVSIVSEAGIEVEYKKGHGTNLSDPDFQTKSVKVHNNYIEGCYWGIAVLTREPFSSSATDAPPYDVQITNNTVIDSESVGIFAASNVSGTPDYTNGRIKNVLVNGNYVEAEAGTNGTGIYFYDTDGGKILNNTVIGHQKQLKFGRNSTIFPIGYFDIRGNELTANSDAVGQVFQLESSGNDITILFDGNVFNGNSQGVRGIQASSLSALNILFILRNNIFRNCTDGILISNMASSVQYSSLTGNYAFDCTDRGFDVAIENGIATDNISVNCVNPDIFNGTGMTANGNKDL